MMGQIPPRSGYRRFVDPLAASCPVQAPPGTIGSPEPFEEWLASDLRAARDASARVLVVSPFPLDSTRVRAHGRATIVLQEPANAGAGRSGHHFASGSFDVAYLHRLSVVTLPGRWLERAYRLLEPGGRIAVAVEPAEFSFAPLPAGGDAHLLARMLTDAGFHRPRVLHRSSRLIVAGAHCAERGDAW